MPDFKRIAKKAVYGALLLATTSNLVGTIAADNKAPPTPPRDDKNIKAGLSEAPVPAKLSAIAAAVKEAMSIRHAEASSPEESAQTRFVGTYGNRQVQVKTEGNTVSYLSKEGDTLGSCTIEKGGKFTISLFDKDDNDKMIQTNQYEGTVTPDGKVEITKAKDGTPTGLVDGEATPTDKAFIGIMIQKSKEQLPRDVALGKTANLKMQLNC